MANVREYALGAGLSKNDLCKRADMDHATHTRAENGEPIFEYNVAKIAKALSAALRYSSLQSSLLQISPLVLLNNQASVTFPCKKSHAYKFENRPASSDFVSLYYG